MRGFSKFRPGKKTPGGAGTGIQQYCTVPGIKTRSVNVTAVTRYTTVDNRDKQGDRENFVTYQATYTLAGPPAGRQHSLYKCCPLTIRQYRTHLYPAGTSVCSSHRQVKARAWVVGEACIPDYATTETAADSTAAAPPRPTDGTGYRYMVQVQKHRGSRDTHGTHTNLTTSAHQSYFDRGRLKLCTSVPARSRGVYDAIPRCIRRAHRRG
jgi:hypothetical protein